MNRKGITLIELLVALTMSGIMIAGAYKTFVSQQHTYAVQDQVVD
ncbi:MAG: PilW family protein, partial [Flavisolibacter sp.]